MRVALLGAGAPWAGELGHGLRAAGARAALVRAPAPPPGPLRLRKLGDDLERVPGAWLALVARDPDVAHAFSAADGVAAGAWAETGGGRSVLTLPGVARRDQVARRRLRLATTVRALRTADAVVAPSVVARDALWRWLAVEARVIRPGVELPPVADGPPVVVVARSDDALGLAALRALARGSVVVAARGTADAEVGGEDVGRPADLDDARDLARALAEARELARESDTPERCRQRARAFSPAACAAAHLALYRDLVSPA